MNIRPPSGDSPQRIDAPRTGPAAEPRAPEREPGAAAPGAASADRLELSGEARELEAALRARNLSLTQLAPERLREILDRIASGHYDRPEVIEATVRMLSSDPAAPPPTKE
jgi:hypothetical protein